ncbi:hypothetical protein V8C37DRAFT_309564 [Trichoderma ceciliae]
MSESEAQHRFPSPRRMPLSGPARQRHGPPRDTKARSGGFGLDPACQPGQQRRHPGWGFSGSRGSQGFPSALILGIQYGGGPLIIIGTYTLSTTRHSREAASLFFQLVCSSLLFHRN